jgi:hypothetical protein
MSLTPRQVAKLAQDLSGKSEAAVDEALRTRHLDPSTKIAVKREVAATAQRQTIAARLATDDAQWHPAEQPMQSLTEVERLMQRAGLRPGMTYTEADIDEGCRLAGIVDPTERLGIKLEAEQRGMLKPRRAAEDSRRLYGMSASAERPKGNMLLNADGTPRTLRFS